MTAATTFHQNMATHSVSMDFSKLNLFDLPLFLSTSEGDYEQFKIRVTSVNGTLLH